MIVIRLTAEDLHLTANAIVEAARLCRVAPQTICYAADSLATSQPGNTSTAGWHLRARARILARSTPRLTRPFSIAEMVACGMPVSSASWLWLSSCSSRRMRTDSPTETSTRRFATLKSFISRSPIVVRSDLNDLNQQRVRHYAVYHSPFQAKARRSMPLPLAGESLIVETLDGAQSRRSGKRGNVLPFFVALQNLHWHRAR